VKPLKDKLGSFFFKKGNFGKADQVRTYRLIPHKMAAYNKKRPTSLRSLDFAGSPGDTLSKTFLGIISGSL
jgi:hypothetical protein